MSLELDKLTLPYAYNTQLSYGANFCSVLAKNQQRALAIELTKCHIKEIAAEHAIFYLHEEGSITGSQHHVYISILRKYDLPTYVSVAVLSILASYFTNKSAQPDKVEPTIIKSELAVVLNTIEKRISVEEKACKKERKQFREQILSLQCQLNSSFAVPQSSIGAPASGMKNNRSSNMVTPFLNRD